MIQNKRNLLVKAPLVILLLWALQACSYLPETDSLETSNTTVSETRNYIRLESSTLANSQDLGFLFIPGGLVDPHAYIEALSKVASQGWIVIIAKVPANLAISYPDQAYALLEDLDTSDLPSQWFIGGHSLGGTVAAMNVYNHPESFKGLILEASYPPESYDLSESTVPVLSISAENDGLATVAKIEAAKKLLPASTVYEQIAGGCHAYFGSYGAQSGDGTPTISRDEQQDEAASLILASLAAAE